jgi:hypothetical protein
MTPAEQKLWEKAARLAYRETEKTNEGRFDDWFYRVALDYYSILLTNHVKETINGKSN